MDKNALQDKQCNNSSTLEEENEERIAAEEPSCSWVYDGIDLTHANQEYLRYKPEVIAHMNDKDLLINLFHLYNPSSQPWYEDELQYITLMPQADSESIKRDH